MSSNKLLFYPSNFDLDFFCNEYNLPQPKVALIIDLFTVNNYKTEKDQREYFHSAKYLWKLVGGNIYSSIMAALIDFGFLINTKGYEIGVNSRAYKVSDKYYYNLELREYLLEETSIGKNLVIKRERDNLDLYNKENLNNVPILKRKAYMPPSKIRINYSPLIENLLGNKITVDMEEFAQIVEKNNLTEKPNKYKNYLAAAISINSGNLYYKVDFNQRFYSPISNFPKILRKCIKINGERMVGIDMSNSQPYLLGLLADRHFLLSLVNKNLIEVNLRLFNSFINHLKTKPKDLIEFNELVRNGLIYEVFMADLGVKNRKKIKKQFIYIINDWGISEGKLREKLRPIIRKKFPTIDKLLNLLKSVNYKYSSSVLMRMEAQRFAIWMPQNFYYEEKNKNIPLFTIHDCFLTNESNIDYFESWFKGYIKENGMNFNLKRE